MLNALSEKKDEYKETINQVGDFLKKYKSELFLQSRRERVKAKPGISLSIFAPDRSLYAMKEIIYSVDWTKFETSYDQFKMVRDIVE